ncbi:MAG TPA: cell division protein ZapA [Sphingomonadales bacterium]|jgi:cell division protein ZapA
MGQVTVRINDQPYQLACRDGEEPQIEALARYVDSKVRSLAGSVGNVGDARLLMMAALIITDELMEARQAAEGRRAEAITERINQAADSIEDIAARLASA